MKHSLVEKVAERQVMKIRHIERMMPTTAAYQFESTDDLQPG